MADTVSLQHAMEEAAVPSSRARTVFEDYFGLRHNPFPVVPDVLHFYMPEYVEVVVAELMHAIETRKGFMTLTGEVGLGKTTIARHILNKLEEAGAKTSYVFNTLCRSDELLEHINRDFGIEDNGGGVSTRLAVLNQFLLEQNASGVNCVIIIDDAQNLSEENLELVRMISNLESDTEKLVQILLVGQTELDVKLRAYGLRQLASRIVVNAKARPYTLTELTQYVRTRLKSADPRGIVQIRQSALALLHKLTGGNPRRANILLDRALYAAVAQQTNDISPRVLLTAASEVGMALPRRGGWKQWGAVAAGLALIAAGVVGYSSISQLFAPVAALDAPDDMQAKTSSVLREGTNEDKVPMAQTQGALQRALPADGDSGQESPAAWAQEAGGVDWTAIDTFLNGYQLHEYRDALAQALAQDRFDELATEIAQATSLQLVILPSALAEPLTEYTILSYRTGRGESKSLLFWKPDIQVGRFEVGYRGEEVRSIQRLLARLFLYNDRVDGVVGHNTRGAVMAFQLRNGLAITGYPDPVTLFLLHQQARNMLWTVQVGSFRSQENALGLRASLEQRGVAARVVNVAGPDGQEWYVVRVGAEKDRPQAVAIRDRLAMEPFAGKELMVLPIEGEDIGALAQTSNL